MKTYDVEIEEHLTQIFQVEASSPEEALEIAEAKWYDAEFVLDDPAVGKKLACVFDRDTEEWSEQEEF